MEDHIPAEIEPTVDPRAGKAKKIAILGTALSIVFSAIAITSILTSSSNVTFFSPDESISNEPIANDSTDLYWAPLGFTVWKDDSNIAYRWSKKNKCDSYGCVNAEFISKLGCPNDFYAAVNWLDSSDSVISYDNATLPSLGSMQTANLQFDDIEGSSSSAQMAEITCR